MCLNWKKIKVPKDRVVTLVKSMDTDCDGYISFGEIVDLLKQYHTELKESYRDYRRKK